MPLDESILGKGVYTPREAARLVGETPQQIVRWTRGSGPSEPLWTAYFQFIEDSTELSFLDLIEVRVVHAMRRSGVSLQAIRFAIEFAQEKFGINRPLASKDFKTDGGEILMDAIEEDGEYVSLARKRPGQKVFREIVSQSLNDLEYEAGLAARWRPTGHEEVIIDPARQFGNPLLDKYGISTNILYREHLQLRDLPYLSKIYEIPSRAARRAIAYEEALEKSSRILSSAGSI